MNKKKGIISLILTVVLIGLLGFTTIVGFGDAHIFYIICEQISALIFT